MASASLSSISSFIPIFVGVSLGLLLRPIVSSKKLNKFANTSESLSLKLLLPLFLVESILNTPLNFDLFFAFIFGFLIPVSCFVMASWLVKIWPLLTPNLGAIRFLVSTFGGGNRGTALLVLLYVSHPDFSDYLKWFSFIDFGNFACLLFVIGPLIRRYFGVQAESATSLLKSLSQNYVVITIIVVAGYFILQSIFPVLDYWLTASLSYRKFAFTSLIFFSISMKLAPNEINRRLLPDIAIFGAIRLLIGLLFISLAMIFKYFPAPALAATFILFIMPPSSILPAMVNQSGASNDIKNYISVFAGASNLIYIALISLVMISSTLK
jgi:predicted permease